MKNFDIIWNIKHADSHTVLLFVTALIYVWAIHSVEEKKTLPGLSTYFARIFGLSDDIGQKWSTTLLWLARIIPTTPFLLASLGFCSWDSSLSWEVAALLTDDISTHWITGAPGLLSTIFSIPIIIVLFFFIGQFQWASALIGAGLFAGIWLLYAMIWGYVKLSGYLSRRKVLGKM